MRIVIIGSGYVGLVTGACLAEMGHDVVCADTDRAKIGSLSRGHIPFFEPGLGALVTRETKRGKLCFSADPVHSVETADVVFIAVGTPSRSSDGHADLSNVYSAVRMVAGAVNKFTVIVCKSTVPLGTGDEIERVVAEVNPDADVAIASNPEFLREGQAIDDFRKPDRVVIGIEDDRARQVMSEVYAPLKLPATQMLYTSRRAAELIKYASNAFLAVKITFINEVADLCEAADASIADVARGIGLDQRIGPRFLEAGPGFGGSCFPKDTLAIVKTAQDAGHPLRLIETTIAVNDQRKRNMAAKVVHACGGSVRGRTVGILGLTFKPDTDDMRGAPSLDIIRALQDYGAKIRAYDPHGMKSAKTLLAGVEFATDAYDAATSADVLVLVTHWNEFRDLDLAKLKSLMAAPVLVDLRNMWSPDAVAEHGFSLISIGAPPLLRQHSERTQLVSEAYVSSMLPLLTLSRRRTWEFTPALQTARAQPAVALSER